MGFFLPFNTFAVFFCFVVVDVVYLFFTFAPYFFLVAPFIFFGRWNVSFVLAYASECFYLSSYLHAHSPSDKHEYRIYLFMFSQFDFLLLLPHCTQRSACTMPLATCYGCTAHTNLDQERIYVPRYDSGILVVWRMMHRIKEQKNHLKIYLTREKLLAQFMVYIPYICVKNCEVLAAAVDVEYRASISPSDWNFSFPTNFDLFIFSLLFFSLTATAATDAGDCC